jgi:hypothetical protein
MIFVGYEPYVKGFRCADPKTRKITVSRHVKFMKKTFPKRGIESKNCLNEKIDANKIIKLSFDAIMQEDDEQQNEDLQTSQPSASDSNEMLIDGEEEETENQNSTNLTDSTTIPE